MLERLHARGHEPLAAETAAEACRLLESAE
jgi:hypothetical protein